MEEEGAKRESENASGKHIYEFAEPETPLDLENPVVIKQLKAINPSLLTCKYRRAGDIKKTIQTLMTMGLAMKNLRVIEEIVYTYIYFNDFTSASHYLRHNQMINNDTKYMNPLIEMLTLDSDDQRDCSDTRLFSIVRRGLLYCYREYFIRALISFYRRKCKGCFSDCLRRRLEGLLDIFTDEYVSKLSYREAKYLYRVMPRKDKFIFRMVKSNPGISLRLYKEYAKIYGIQEDDIDGLVMEGSSLWAIALAYKRGWIKPAMEGAVIRRIAVKRPFIKSRENWKYTGDKEGILFLIEEIGSTID